MAVATCLVYIYKQFQRTIINTHGSVK